MTVTVCILAPKDLYLRDRIRIRCRHNLSCILLNYTHLRLRFDIRHGCHWMLILDDCFVDGVGVRCGRDSHTYITVHCLINSLPLTPHIAVLVGWPLITPSRGGQVKCE